MTETYDRRTFLRRAGLATGAAVAVAAGAPRPAAAADEELAPFHHGVASGDPTATTVVLWTRVTPPAGQTAPIPVAWEVATDLDFSDVVATGTTDAIAGNDWTVKPVPADLASFTYHFFRFTALGTTSIIGRTKTAPAAGQDVDRLRFGLVSCSNYEGGYFNAYARLSERNDLDAVLCPGDYIYEYGQGGYGPGEEIGRVTQPPTEMTTLEQYRGRFAHYRLDPDLRRVHQLYPWINTWDDHETTNDSWRDGAENHDDDGSFDPEDEAEGDDDRAAELGLDWEERKRRAWKAYREWLPIAVDASSTSEPIVLYRALDYGDLADIVVMDTRIEGRDEPVFEILEPGLIATAIDDPERRMISPAQQTFVENALSSSDACWKILLQQVMLMQWRIGALPDGVSGAPDFPNPVTTAGGNSVNGDAWDGYNGERTRLFSFLRDNDVTDLVVLTGDIHTTWMADLTEDPLDVLGYDPTGLNPAVPRNLGVEFVCPSVTSDNIDEIVVEGGGTTEAGVAAARSLEVTTMAENPHIKSVELEHHGYGIIDVTAERTTYDVFFVEHLTPADGETFHQSWYVEKATDEVVGHRVIQADAATATRTAQPAVPAAAPPQVTTTTTTTTTTPGSTSAGGGTLPDTGLESPLVLGVTAAVGAAVARRAVRARDAAAETPAPTSVGE